MERTEEWTDERMDRQLDGQTDGETDGWSHSYGARTQNGDNCRRRPNLSFARAEKALVVFGTIGRAIADDVEPCPRIRQRLPVWTYVVVRTWTGN